MAKLEPDDIFETYGSFNDLTVGSKTPVGSRQTLTTTEALSGWLENFYTPDALEGKSVYDGVVMATIPSRSPTLQSNQALIEYLTDSSVEPLHYVYKVYIPEVEPRCINFSDRNGPSGEFTNAQRVMTLPNAIIDPKVPASENMRAIEAGTYVQVVFANQEKLKNPKIVAIGKKVIELKGKLNDPDGGSLKTAFSSGRGRAFLPASRGGTGTTGTGNFDFPTSTASSANKVVLVGDSQTDQGPSGNWSTLGKYVSEALGSRNLEVEVLAKSGRGVIANKSFFGMNSTAGRLPKLLDSFKPGLVIVELGGNDSDWASRGDKKSTYEAEMKLWVDTIKAAGVSEIKWFGPSYATKILDSGTAYDTQRQRIRDWQSAYLPGLGVTWYDMVPYTKDLTIKSDGVHFPAGSYSSWSDSLFASGGPLASVRGTESATN
jgi:lysophospholipase L1-like esterase